MTVSIDGVANDGAIGELGDVYTDVENLIGSTANDTLIGSDTANVLNGGSGSDALDGGLGADSLTGGAGFDTVTYASRINPLQVSNNGIANDGESGEADNVSLDTEVMIGGTANDTLTSIGGYSDRLDGNLGSDELIGGSGDFVDYSRRTTRVVVTLDWTANDGDPLAGEQDNAYGITGVIAGAGDDTITGNNSGNVIYGQAGNDVIGGAGGNDLFFGDWGDDTLDGGAGPDNMYGGSGVDTVDYSSRTSALTITAGDELANDGEVGEGDNVRNDIENVRGGSASDVVSGNALANTLVGGAGRDSLNGLAGADSLIVRDGVRDDVVCGGGTDVVTADTFDVSNADCETIDSAFTMDTFLVSGPAAGATLFLRPDSPGYVSPYAFGFDSGTELFECRMDDDPFAPCSSPMLVPELAVGTHEFEVRSVDSQGNPDPTPVSRQFTVARDSVVFIDGDHIRYVAVSGQANTVTLLSGNVSVGSSSVPGTIIRSTNHPLGAGPGCVASASTQVGCPNSAVSTVSISTGDDNDSITAGSTSIPQVIDAGDGNDSVLADQPAPSRTISGGFGDDYIAGHGSTSELVSGGEGTDRFMPYATPGGTFISLDGINNDGRLGYEADNILPDIENLTGTVYADTLIGSDAANVIDGWSGNDTFDGGLGADVFIGGPGVDTVTYAARVEPVQASIGNLPNDGELGEADMIDVNVENLIGGSGNDTLTGNAYANVITGGAGSDTVDGSAGDDTFLLRDGFTDQALCSDGTDQVTADLVDSLFNCETANLPQPASITAGPADGSTINVASPEFSFSAAAPATFGCRIDDGGWDSCTSPWTAPSLTNGAHSFSVRAIDSVGDVDQTPVTRNFTVSMAPPETTITGGPTEGTSTLDTTPTFTFSSDTGTAFECSMNGDAFSSCSSPHTTAILGNGARSFNVRATLGEAVDPTPAIRNFTVDSETPIVTLTAPHGFTTDSTPAVQFSTYDVQGVVSTDCAVDFGTPVPCSTGFELDPLSPGEHYIEVMAHDAAGNAGGAVGAFVVDDTAPDVAVVGSALTIATNAELMSSLTIERDATAYRVEDVAPLKAGAGCAQETIWVVTCEDSAPITTASVDVADLDDTVSIDPGVSLAFTIDGGTGNDEITGSSGVDSIIGGDGADQIDGAGAADTVAAGAGDDTIDARDTLADTIDCSDGSDQSLSDQADILSGCETDTKSNVVANIGSLFPLGPEFVQYLAADGAVNDIAQTATAQTVDFQDSTSPLAAGPGCSQVNSSTVSCDRTGVEYMWVKLGDGNDTISLQTSATLSGATLAGSGDDVITGGDGQDAYNDESGNDVFHGGAGSMDTVNYGFSDVGVGISLNGEADDGPPGATDNIGTDVERVYASDHSDTIVGSDGPDFVYGGAGDDDIEGHGGDDLVYSGPGDDTFDGDTGADEFHGDEGLDTLDYSDRIEDLVIHESQPSGAPAEGDFFDNSVERILGGAGDDSIVTDSSNNVIDPGAGEDTVQSGTGDDTVLLRDKQADITDCGDDQDSVVADNGIDQINASCEAADLSPVVTITAGPAEGSTITESTPVFEFSSNDALATFECSVDGAAFATCASPFSTPVLANGMHSFSVRPRDAAISADLPVVSRSFAVDALLEPDTFIDAAPVATAEVSSRVLFHSNIAESDFECAMITAGELAVWEPCSSPAYFSNIRADGEYLVQIRSVLDGVVDPTPASQQLRIDSVPPEVEFTDGPTGTIQASSATVSFSSADAVGFYCSVDGADFEDCSSPYEATGLSDGQHTISVVGYDLADNHSAVAERVFKSDAVPVTTITAGPAEGANVGADPITFEFESEHLATFSCSLDGATIEPCTSPHEVSGLGQGAHSIEIRATDDDGNIEQAPAARTFSIDLTEPVVTITTGPSGTTNVKAPVFEFTSDEPGSTFYCSGSDLVFDPCASPFQLPEMPEGQSSFSVYAVDAVGNASSALTQVFDIQGVPPATTIYSGPADGSTTSVAPVVFYFDSDDPGAVFRCEVDQGSPQPCDSPFTLSGLADGAHSLEVIAVDAGDLADPTPATTSFTVDSTAPSVTISGGANSPTSDRTPSIEFSADEAPVTFECVVDSGWATGCVSPFDVESLGDGTHEVQIRATDLGGNVGVAATAVIVVDGASTTSILSGPTDGQAIGTTEATFEFFAPDAQGYECALDGDEFVSCASAHTITSLANGVHEFLVRSIDTTGNIETPPANAQFEVDLIAPTATITSGPSSPANQLWIQLEFESSEPGSTFECSLDGAPPSECSSPFSTDLGFSSAPLEGSHEIAVTAVDVAGNASVSAIWSFQTDITPPDTSVTTSATDTTWLPAEEGSLDSVQRLTGDVDGDDRDDVVTITPDGIWRVALSDGDQFQYGVGGAVWKTDFGAWLQDRFVADVDGDGKADAVTHYAGDWHVAFSTGIAFGSAEVLSEDFGYSDSPQDPVDNLVGDVNGDGCADLIAVYTNYELQKETWMVDGTKIDGQSTGCASGRDPVWGERDNDGLVWEWFVYHGAVSGWLEHYLIDVNDREELLSPVAASSSSLRVYDRWDMDVGHISDNDATYSAVPFEAYPLMLGDVTGDGRDDLIGWSSANGDWLVAPQVQVGTERVFSDVVDRVVPRARRQFVISEDLSYYWARGFERPHSGESQTHPQALLGDATGDGLGDAMVVDRTTGEWKLLPSLGDRFGYTQDIVTPPSFTASSENGSTFECAIDGNPFLPCTGELSIWGGLLDGNHSLAVRAVDSAGNADRTPYSVSASVDLSAPTTRVDLPRNDTTTSDNTPMMLFRSEPGSTFECRFDEEPFGECASTGKSVADAFALPRFDFEVQSPLSDGMHRFEIVATDRAGNVGNVASREFRVDSTPPSIDMFAGPAEGASASLAESVFKFRSEPGATHRCFVDGLEVGICVSPFYFAGHLLQSGTLYGPHTFAVEATDLVGNTTAPPAIRSLSILETQPELDTTGPDTSIGFPAPDEGAVVTNSKVRFGFTSGELLSTFECSIDAEAPEPCVSPYERIGLADGEHTFTVRATDLAGNSDQAPATRAFEVQTGAEPDTTIDGSAPSPSNDRTPNFEFSSSMGGASFECRVDTTAWRSCSSPYAVPAGSSLQDGNHSFEVRAETADTVDRSSATATFVLDTSPPVVTIDSAPSNGAVVTNATVPVEFASADPSVTYECGVDGGAFAACTSPWSAGPFESGERSIAVRAIDQSGNGSLYAVRSFAVDVGGGAESDITAPVVSVYGGPQSGSTVAVDNIELQLDASETVVFECKVDASEYLPCSSPFTVGSLAEGPHSVSIRARDADQNQSNPVEAEFTVDTIHPSAPQVDGGSWIANSSGFASATFSGEPGAIFECRLDSPAWHGCEPPAGFGPLPEGNHKLYVRQTDEFSRVSDEANGDILVDYAAPLPPENLAVISNTGERVTVAWEMPEDTFRDSGEAGLGVGGFIIRSRVRVDDLEPWAAWSEYETIGYERTFAERDDVPFGGSVEFQVAAFDVVGNTSAVVSTVATMSVFDPPTVLSAFLDDGPGDGGYVGNGALFDAYIWAFDDSGCVSELSVGVETSTDSVYEPLFVTPTPCDADRQYCAPSCDAGTFGTVSIHSDVLPEGVNKLRAGAADRQKSVSTSGKYWTVLVDKTSPSATSQPEVSYVAPAGNDPGQLEVSLSFIEDPEIAPGVPGAGIYSLDVRARTNGGEFGQWFYQSSQDGSPLRLQIPLLVDSVEPGDSVEIEFRATDGVGNASLVDSVTVEVPNADAAYAAPSEEVGESQSGYIEARVFLDGNKNGIQESFEGNAPGVSVTVDGVSAGSSPDAGSLAIQTTAGSHVVAVRDLSAGAVVTTRSTLTMVDNLESSTALIGIYDPFAYFDPGEFSPVFVLPFDKTVYERKQFYWPVNTDILAEMRADPFGQPLDSPGNRCAASDGPATSGDGVCTNLTYEESHDVYLTHPGAGLVSPAQRWEKKWSPFTPDLINPFSSRVIQDNTQHVFGQNGEYRGNSGSRRNSKINNPFDAKDPFEQQFAFFRYAIDPPEVLHPESKDKPRETYVSSIDQTSRIYWYKVPEYAPGYFAIEYWFFYTFNHYSDVGIHEADWEHISVVFRDGEPTPAYVDYAQHGPAKRYSWNPQYVDFFRGTSHPIAWVARGSQATYPKCGQSFPLSGGQVDQTAQCMKSKEEFREKGFDYRRIYVCPEVIGLNCDVTNSNMRNGVYPSPRYYLGAAVEKYGWACWQGRWGPNEPWVLDAVKIPGHSPKSPMVQTDEAAADRGSPQSQMCGVDQ